MHRTIRAVFKGLVFRDHILELKLNMAAPWPAGRKSVHFPVFQFSLSALPQIKKLSRLGKHQILQKNKIVQIP